MSVISGKIVSAERILSSFNNLQKYHSKGQKIYTRFLLNDGKTYWSDNHIDEFKVGSYVEFYGGEGYNNIYINQDTAKGLIKQKNDFLMGFIVPLVAIILSSAFLYVSGKITNHPAPVGLYYGFMGIFINLLFMMRDVSKISKYPKGEDMKRLRKYAKGYVRQQKMSYLNIEDVNTSLDIKKSIYHKDR